MTATIDRAAYFAARREGMSPRTAAYAARPAVLDLDFLTHYQFDGAWANFDHGGRTYRVQLDDLVATEGDCTSCRELVDAYEACDENIAWMTPDEFDRSTHRVVTVTVLDADGDETGWSRSLFGVCGDDSTPTLRRLDDRYLADTVDELRHEVDGMRAAAARKRAAELAATREAYMAAVAACG